jgi:hypothetical protein
MYEDKLELGEIENNIITIKTKNNSYPNGIINKNKNCMDIMWCHNKNEQYYEIENINYSLTHIMDKHEYYKLFFNDEEQLFLKINDMLFNFKNTYKYSMVNEILILHVDDILFFYYKNDNDVYVTNDTPKNFDLKKYKLYTTIDFLNWEEAIKHYMIYNYGCNYLQIENIIFLNNFYKAYFNFSHMHVVINNKYYKFYIDKDIIYIDNVSFVIINNNVLFESSDHYYIPFIKHKHVLIKHKN